MKRVGSVLTLVGLVMLATVTLVTVLGSLIGFYDWMWLLLVLGAIVGLVFALQRDENG